MIDSGRRPLVVVVGFAGRSVSSFRLLAMKGLVGRNQIRFARSLSKGCLGW